MPPEVGLQRVLISDICAIWWVVMGEAHTRAVFRIRTLKRASYLAREMQPQPLTRSNVFVLRRASESGVSPS